MIHIRTTLAWGLWMTSLSAWGADVNRGPIPGELRGLWRTEGYNELLHITRDEVTMYYVTAGSSVLERRQSHVEFARDNPLPSLVAPDRLAVASGLPEYRYFYRRVDALPGPAHYFGRGETQAARNAAANFDVFWDTFDENYSYFDQRGVDWNAVRATWRPRIQAANDEDTLKQALTSIIRQLGDRHALVRMPDGRLSADAQPLQSVSGWLVSEQARQAQASEEDFHPTMAAYIGAQVLGGRGHTGANGKLVWGVLENGVGYLGFLGCGGLLSRPGATLDDQLVELRNTLDRAMAVLADTPAMVVDLRINGGGYDEVALGVVARFTDRRRLAFTKQARVGDVLSEAQPITIAPEPGRTPYLKPTYVLTSDYTASAAEIGVLGFKALPHITLAGAPTMGIFSDMMGARLPNGWSFTLSNEVYTAADGISYEGLGVPPVLSFPYELDGDFYRAFDNAVVVAAAEALQRAR